MRSYVRRDLLRNPRRTLASLAGVALGVGLFAGVLFFIDGSGASMTKRAIAPLTLDMQRVLSSPLGGDLRFLERLSGPSSLRRGQRARITLTVTNDRAEPANEVVVNGEPPHELGYVAGTTTLNGRPLRDVEGRSPLAQGLARSGLNLGTIRPRENVRLTYVVRARRDLTVGALRLRGRISSREDVVPEAANAPPPLSVKELRARVSRIPGVVAADGLAFVDLPPGSLRSGDSTVTSPVRLFAFDRAYVEHYPSIEITAGSMRSDAALVSVEAARALGGEPGRAIELELPGRPKRLSLTVSGVADLGRAKPLFSSRSSSKLEDFLYVPNAVVVSPAVFEREVIPAFRSARANLGNVIKSFPTVELDVLVERSRLDSDPGTALAQTKAIARSINRIAPRQDQLIDNISNTLEVARDDAVVGKRMFFFLGLPGILLAAFLAAYAASVLASTERRERAMLRIRGAHSGHLVRMLAYKTAAFSGVGSLLGVGIGFVSAMAVLGKDSLLEASAGDLLLSGIVAAAVGMLTTGLALFVPGRRSLGREVSEERREIEAVRVPAWRRLRLDFALLGVAAAAEAVALKAGAFDPPTASVSAGEAVSLPSRLMIAPLIAWFGGCLLAVRISMAVSERLPVPAPPRFGSVVGGTLGRSLRRRSWTLATGMIGVGLVAAFGIGLSIFAAVYDDAKAADARFVVGSDVRVTPSVLSPRRLSSSFASRLEVRGVREATPVVFKLENSVLVGPHDQATKDLAAIEPRGFEQVAALSDSFFVEGTAAGAITALRRDPRALLVDTETAAELSVEEGDRVEVLLARGTRRQRLAPFRVAGLFERFPAFPQGTNLVAGIDYYKAKTSLRRADFFLVRGSDGGAGGIERAVTNLRNGPGRQSRLNIESTRTAFDKDQSSLTAVNFQGLVDLDSFFTLLMSAAAIAIFVFGLMLQRRREYVTLLAQGMRARELQLLVIGEAALVAACGLVAGAAVGIGMAFLLMHVLGGLFILDPVMTLPVGDVLVMAGLVLAAAVVFAVVAIVMLHRLRPTEILREQ